VLAIETGFHKIEKRPGSGVTGGTRCMRGRLTHRKRKSGLNEES
jgi:hypothetical protein